MKKALIVTAHVEHLENIDLDFEQFDTIICADGGLLVADKLNLTPTPLIGDYDSMKMPDVTCGHSLEFLFHHRYGKEWDIFLRFPQSFPLLQKLSFPFYLLRDTIFSIFCALKHFQFASRWALCHDSAKSDWSG